MNKLIKICLSLICVFTFACTKEKEPEYTEYNGDVISVTLNDECDLLSEEIIEKSQMNKKKDFK